MRRLYNMGNRHWCVSPDINIVFNSQHAPIILISLHRCYAGDMIYTNRPSRLYMEPDYIVLGDSKRIMGICITIAEKIHGCIGYGSITGGVRE